MKVTSRTTEEESTAHFITTFRRVARFSPSVLAVFREYIIMSRCRYEVFEQLKYNLM